MSLTKQHEELMESDSSTEWIRVKLVIWRENTILSVFKYTCIILTLVWIIAGNVNLHINTKHNTKT